jgi:hypothetical protein
MLEISIFLKIESCRKQWNELPFNQAGRKAEALTTIASMTETGSLSPNIANWCGPFAPAIRKRRGNAQRNT